MDDRPPVSTLDALLSRLGLSGEPAAAIRGRIAAIVDGKVTPSADQPVGLFHADSFVRHAVPILIHAIPKGDILVLNGTRAGTRYPSIAELARGIGIEENSVETATGFFGRIGGGQAIILPASTQTVDVRGLFHGFKNLLSNLQVLYVVKSARDIGEIGGIRFDAVPGRRRRTPNVTARETTETE